MGTVHNTRFHQKQLHVASYKQGASPEITWHYFEICVFWNTASFQSSRYQGAI